MALNQYISAYKSLINGTGKVLINGCGSVRLYICVRLNDVFICAVIQYLIDLWLVRYNLHIT